MLALAMFLACVCNAAQEADVCAICTEPLFGTKDEAGRPMTGVVVGCGDKFHRSCIQEWRAGGMAMCRKCPCCRAPLNAGRQWKVVQKPVTKPVKKPARKPVTSQRQRLRQQGVKQRALQRVAAWERQHATRVGSNDVAKMLFTIQRDFREIPMHNSKTYLDEFLIAFARADDPQKSIKCVERVYNQVLLDVHLSQNRTPMTKALSGPMVTALTKAWRRFRAHWGSMDAEQIRIAQMMRQPRRGGW